MQACSQSQSLAHLQSMANNIEANKSGDLSDIDSEESNSENSSDSSNQDPRQQVNIRSNNHKYQHNNDDVSCSSLASRSV